MKSLTELLPNILTVKGYLKNPRSLMLEEIYRLVNTDRKLEGYKQLPIKVYAIKTAHLSLMDMDFLVKKMRSSSYPAKTFFGLLKLK